MNKNKILLSTGSLIWFGLQKAMLYAGKTGFDGLEVVPSKNIVLEIKKIDYSFLENNYNLNMIGNVHQSWRLDMGMDKSYGIQFPTNIFFAILRFVFFPKVQQSNDLIKFLSDNLNVPVTVHDLSNKWTEDNNNKEFSGGISYEIIGNAINPEKLKQWMKNPKHNIVTDSRDDQSLLWARKYGFDSWQKFWIWIGVDKIESYQLTFIGYNGLRKIFRHQKSLPEEQLLWLYQNNWRGKVVVEVNPLIALILCKGNLKKGFKIINQFVRQTLFEGRRWS